MATNRRFQLLIATTAEWELKNPILRKGEPGVEIVLDNGEVVANNLKVGDGLNTWSVLPYTSDNLYNYSDLTTVTLGGIEAGTSLEGKKLKDIIKDLLSPYIIPSFTTIEVNDVPFINLEVGKPLPTNLVTTWSFSNLANMADESTGLIQSDKDDILATPVSINPTDLTYTIVTSGAVTSIVPLESVIQLAGYDIENNLINSDQFLINWKGLIRYGVNATGIVSSSSHVNALSNSILTNDPDGTYSFLNGYPFILIPNFIDMSNKSFVDGDSGLAFAMDLQSNYDSNLPSQVVYNNGSINITYNIYRGEFFYNAPTQIIIQ